MKRLVLLFVICVLGSRVYAQQQLINGKLVPAALRMKNGDSVTTIKQWEEKRRPELIDFFRKEMYGQSPGKPTQLTFKVFESDKKALGGKATRKQIAVYFEGNEVVEMDILLYIPNQVKDKVPAFLSLNFFGNQSVHPDASIKLPTGRMVQEGQGIVNHLATAASRGSDTARWPIEMILDKGYAIATVYYGDIDPDHKTEITSGVRSLYPDLQNRADNFGTIAAWAWGLSRVMDYLETDKRIDSKHIAVLGLSRLGKAALWAGATYERFALTISNESGAGGAKLFHSIAGESIRKLCTKFPNWYCRNFNKYIDRDAVLPFDQHMLISLIAPRPVYIASASEDLNSNPEGEFWGAKGADPVYRLLNTNGLPVASWPAINTPVTGRIAYHNRSGKHDITNYDWIQFLNFADRYLKGRYQVN
jgi:hypothetical protein